MARLHVSPVKAVAQRQAPASTTDIDLFSEDSTSTAEKLHRKSTTSASRQKQTRSAVFGATLLNAARVDYRQSSPIRASRDVPGSSRSAAGKLRRVTFHAETPRQNLARAEDIFAVPEHSPEKRPSVLPEKVNHGALKSGKKTPKKQEGDVVPSSDLPGLILDREEEVEALAEPDLASSPPEYAPDPSRTAALEQPAPRQSRPSLTRIAIGNVQVEETLESGGARCTVVFYSQKSGPSYMQCRQSATTGADGGMRCDHHMQKPATVRCTAAVRDGQAQCGTQSSKVTPDGPRCARHLKKRADTYEPPSSQASEPSKEIANSAKLRMMTSSQGRGKRKGHVIIQEEQPKPKRTRSALEQPISTTSTSGPARKSSRTQTSSEEVHHASIEDVQERPGADANYEEEAEDEEEAQDEPEDAGTSNTQRTKGNLNRHLQELADFAESGERSGKCQTKTATSLKRVCDRCTARLEQEELSVQQVGDYVEEVKSALDMTKRLRDNIRADLKGDAYSYVFMSIAQFVRALHVWHDEKTDKLIDSLDAVQHFAMLSKEIVSFKDLIASWKVKVPQRYQGDRAIKDVDMHFIVPLRKLADIFRKQRRVLESRQKARQNLDDIYRQMQQEEAEARQNEVLRLSENDRRKKWQTLHVKRMQCEPDIFERRKLVIPDLSEFEERDADGNRFERLELLKKRITPPFHRIILATKKEWTDAQETALIEGLERYAGPDVFLEIFPQYCRPGGALRPFTVSDVVLKAAWIKSSWAKLQHEHGWEVPDWVDSIPSPL